MRMRVGTRVTARNGLSAVLDRAHYLRVEAIELHSRNPRRSGPRRFRRSESDDFKRERERRGYHVFLVSPLRYNIAASSEGTRVATIRALVEDLRLAARLGADAVVVPPGAHTGAGYEAGIGRAAESLREVLREAPQGPLILIENSCGAGSQIGSLIPEVGLLLDSLPSERVGFCLNVVNAHLAGYPLAGEMDWDHLAAEIETHIGWGRVRLIHLADTPAPRGSRKEKAPLALPGEGWIGRAGFRAMMKVLPKLEVPFIVLPPRVDLMAAKRALEAFQEFVYETCVASI